MKKYLRTIRTRGLSLIFICLLLFAGSALAIEPLTEELPPDLPPDAELEQEEVLTEREEIVEKETDLAIIRIHAQEVKIGERVTVRLEIRNLGEERVEFLVSEMHKPGLEYPDEIEVKKLVYQGLELPYYGWQLSLEPGEETEVEYHITPQTTGMILFPPAIVSDQYGNNFESAPTTLEITCLPDGKCNPGENYIFCPEDCPTGSADGICDGVEDGVCDPDCEKGADPDCELLKQARIGPYVIIGAGIAVLVTAIIGLILVKKILNKKQG